MWHVDSLETYSWISFMIRWHSAAIVGPLTFTPARFVDRLCPKHDHEPWLGCFQEARAEREESLVSFGFIESSQVSRYLPILVRCNVLETCCHANRSIIDHLDRTPKSELGCSFFYLNSLRIAIFSIYIFFCILNVCHIFILVSHINILIVRILDW